MKDLNPGVSPRHDLGAEIRRAREEAGMSQAELAKITGHDRTYVTKAETGDIDPSEAFAAGCDRAFPGRHGWFSRFWRDSHRWDRPYPVWFHDWVEKFERLAVILRAWQPSLVPGLLQTADYARAIFVSWRRTAGMRSRSTWLRGSTVSASWTVRSRRICGCCWMSRSCTGRSGRPQ